MHKSIISIASSLLLSFAFISQSCISVNAFSADSYTSRLTEPENNPESQEYRYYFSNDNIYVGMNYGMPNCTAYAWGRAFELLGRAPRLSSGNAGRWYTENIKAGNYSYGSVPKLGAVACWDKNDNVNGHVAVVEYVSYDRNRVTVSESQYQQANFITYTYRGDSSDHMSRYRFLGYIYIDEPEGRFYGDAFRISASDSEKLITYSENMDIELQNKLNNTALQNFRFEPSGNGTYKIRSISDDMLLFRSGENVLLSNNDGSEQTKWKLSQNDNSLFTINSTDDSNLVLTYTADGFVLNSFSYSENQLWDIQRVTGIEPLSYDKLANRPQISELPSGSINISASPLIVEKDPENNEEDDNSSKYMSVDFSDTKTEYQQFDVVDITGIVLNINDKPIKDLQISKLSVKYDFSKCGQTLVEIQYDGLTAYYPVYITENSRYTLADSVTSYIICQNDEMISEYDVNGDNDINIADTIAAMNK